MEFGHKFNMSQQFAKVAYYKVYSILGCIIEFTAQVKGGESLEVR